MSLSAKREATLLQRATTIIDSRFDYWNDRPSMPAPPSDRSINPMHLGRLENELNLQIRVVKWWTSHRQLKWMTIPKFRRKSCNDGAKKFVRRHCHLAADRWTACRVPFRNKTTCGLLRGAFIFRSYIKRREVIFTSLQHYGRNIGHSWPVVRFNFFLRWCYDDQLTRQTIFRTAAAQISVAFLRAVSFLFFFFYDNFPPSAAQRQLLEGKKIIHTLQTRLRNNCLPADWISKFAVWIIRFIIHSTGWSMTWFSKLKIVVTVCTFKAEN